MEDVNFETKKKHIRQQKLREVFLEITNNKFNFSKRFECVPCFLEIDNVCDISKAAIAENICAENLEDYQRK